MTGVWGRRRLACQGAAFSLLLLVPLLNFYFNWNFIQGWYQSLGIGDFWIVSPLEGLESLLVTRQPYGPLLVGLLLPVLLAAALGRVFCSWICPISFLSGLSDRLRRLWRPKRPIQDRWILLRETLWLALGLELLLTSVLGAPLFVFLSPPGLVGRELMLLVFFRTLALEGVIILVVLALNLLTRRFYCRYLCPLGGLLALLGVRRRLRIARQRGCDGCGSCDPACPLGLSASRDEGSSIYCWNCASCIDACDRQRLAFRFSREAGLTGPSTTKTFMGPGYGAGSQSGQSDRVGNPG